MRLLTEEEIAGVCGRFAKPENKKEGLHLLAEMAADAEHKETLKAVGGWLDRCWLLKYHSTYTLQQGIETFKRGEMPAKDTKADPPMPSKQKAREKCLGKLLD